MSTAALTAAEDWELDFYSRPILEADGRKRWELLITSTPAVCGDTSPFRRVARQERDELALADHAALHVVERLEI